MKKTQIDYVYRQLQTKGYVTRNECLGLRITRLAAIINAIKKEGWSFKTSKVGNDYKYEFIDRTGDRVDYDLAFNF